MNMAAARRTLVSALEISGGILRRRLGRVSIRTKGRANLVTEADLESQKAIKTLLRRRFPGHDFLGEEEGSRLTGAEYLWVADPLDGTTNYAHGYPMFCVSVALLRGGRPILGGVNDPSRGELFIAQEGRGAALNGRPIRVSRAPTIESSLLITGFPYDRAERAGFYTGHYRRFMERCHDVRRSGSAALDLAWIAAGRADGFWEFSLSPWDVAAGLLLVREAGGLVTDFSGRPWSTLAEFGRETLATNGRVHRAMLRVLNRHRNGSRR